MLLIGCARSPFRNFESCCRFAVGLDEKFIQLILKQYNSFFFIFELSPSIHTVKDVSEVVHTMGDHDITLRIEYDDVTMKRKPILKQFCGSFETLRFDERSFSTFYLGFTFFGIINLPMLFILIVRMYILVIKFWI